MLKQTKTTGSGKNRKTVPKYTLSELLDQSSALDIIDDPSAANGGYNDGDSGSVMTPGGLILPRRFRDPA